MDNAPSPDASRCLQEVAPHPAAPRGGCSGRGAAEGLHLLGGTPQPLCTLQEEAASLVLARCGAGSLRWVSLGCQPRFLGQMAGCVTKGPENRFFCLAPLLAWLLLLSWLCFQTARGKKLCCQRGRKENDPRRGAGGGP